MASSRPPLHLLSTPFSGLHPHDRPSKFRDKYNIPIMSTDIMLWDKAWEKALRTLSPSEEMFPTLGCMWDEDFYRGKNTGDMDMEFVANDMYKRTCKLQHAIVMLDDKIKKGSYLVTAWMLLEETERRRHLLNGMKAACQYTLFRPDGRALCPEITTTAMLKQRGMAFMDFARDLANGVKEFGPDEVYRRPSEWFQSAVKEPEPWSDKTKLIFKQLSVQRAEFITVYVVQTLMSIMYDLSRRSPGTKRATDLLKIDAYMASTMAQAFSTMFLDKPLIRCQNCTKTPEEVGENAKFMVCSNCKSKLNFPIHYCSSACQKADWRAHKKHCGKEKAAKKLPRTIHDPYWQYPISDQLRAVDPPADGVSWPAEVDFGTPHPDHPHNPALQRQVALLERHKGVDYFLFDDLDRPVPFVVDDPHLKMGFRSIRSSVLFGPFGGTTGGVELMAEHMIRRTMHLPGFSRARILRQLQREYDRDVAAEMAMFEASDIGWSHHPEATFLERMGVMCKGLEAVVPQPVRARF